MNPTICLTMIVRNEEQIIERCLKSAIPYIDYWAICDTGSTDKTRKIIERTLSEVIPGFIYSDPWVNFAHNRTNSFILAKQSLEPDYCLLLDADHELTGSLNSAILSADSYTLTQSSGTIEYPNTRLIKTSRNWKCVSVTHEYWTCDGYNEQHINTLKIIDHEDGGTRHEKYKRDEYLLRKGLLDEPDNERYFFYLAQTLEGSGKTDEAIELYRKRASMGGYHEERWMAQYRAAKLSGIGLEEVWEKNIHRAEPLYWLANKHRKAGNNNLAMLYAKMAKEIPKPTNALFVETPAYTYGPEEEISIAGYYVDRDEGLKYCEKCIENPVTYELAHRNIVHYTQPLYFVDKGTIEVPEIDGFSPGTNSICDGNISVRMLNYTQKYGREFNTRNGGKFQSKTYLNGILVDDSILESWDSSGTILGLEDWRLFKFRSDIWFSANCCMVPDKGGGPQVVIGRLNKELNKIEHLVHVNYGNKWCEKNWQVLPEEINSIGIEMVYSYDPFITIGVNPETGKTNELVRKEGKGLPRWRGSAPPIKIGSYIIGIVHDVIYNSGNEDNVYLHRFIALDDEALEIIAVSNPFYFEHRGIEYTGGMQLENNQVRIMYSVREFQTKWLTIPVDKIISMLGLK